MTTGDIPGHLRQAPVTSCLTLKVTVLPKADLSCYNTGRMRTDNVADAESPGWYTRCPIVCSCIGMCRQWVCSGVLVLLHLACALDCAVTNADVAMIIANAIA